MLGYLGPPSTWHPEPLAPLDDIESVIHSSVVDEVVAALELDDVRYLEPTIALCHQEGKRLRIVMHPGLATVGKQGRDDRRR